MNITKFLRVSKKKDLSDELDGGEQQKKVREGSLEATNRIVENNIKSKGRKFREEPCS